MQKNISDKGKATLAIKKSLINKGLTSTQANKFNSLLVKAKLQGDYIKNMSIKTED